jgi:hypothetical protein
MSDELANLGHEIDQVSSALQRAASARVGENVTANDREGAATRLEGKLNDVAKQVDAQLQADFLQDNGGLVKTVMQGGRLRAQLNARLLETARKIVQQTAAGVSCDAAGRGNNELGSALAQATPMLLEYGGSRRVLAVVPDRGSDSHTDAGLSRALGTNATAVVGGDNYLTICVEASGLSLTHVALEFVERRRDRVEFARRVHARTDIAWNPLVSTETPWAKHW